MEKVNPKWSKFGVVLICEKCGKKLGGDLNPSVLLKDEIKKTLITENLWGEVRVLNSTCLDICPDQKIAVGFVNPGATPTAQVIDPKKDKESLLQSIRDLTRK